MKFDVELVGKIGSMALIDKKDNMIDYTRVARLSRELKPGYIWISSGATEIGRLDFMMRAGYELPEGEDAKTDYAAQGQAILMQTYRQYVDSKYSVRQILVEHHHFNDPVKREHIKRLLLRCREQNAIPIINYNDAVSESENRRMELAALAKSQAEVHECVDNDETAALVACLVHAETLLLLTSVDGIYTDPADPSTIIEEIAGRQAGGSAGNARPHREREVLYPRNSRGRGALHEDTHSLTGGTTHFLRGDIMDKKEKHERTKRILKIVGPIVAAAGLILAVLAVVGFVSFFSSFGSGGMPSLFWCAFVGMPVFVIGLGITFTAFRREIATYQKNESAPVINEFAEDIKPAVQSVASAVRETAAQDAICPDCGEKNDADAKFCKNCGAALRKVCPDCGEQNDADAKFCKSCGKSL